MNLDEARNLLRDSVLHIGDAGTFTDEKLDRAIKVAGYRFLRETRASAASTNITITSATEAVNIRTTITDFEVHWFIRARILYKEVKYAPIQTIEQYYAESTPTGQPTLIGFYSNTSAIVYPQPAAGYTMVLNHLQDLVSWTPGVSVQTTLNIPDEYAYDVIWHGARAYLTLGLVGHGEAQPAMEEFKAVIESAKPKFARNRSPVDDDKTVLTTTVKEP